MLNTDVRNFYFSCISCNNKGEGTEIRHIGGFNDKGGFILLCNKCKEKFFIRVNNPNVRHESRVDTSHFTVLKTLDFDNKGDVKTYNTEYKGVKEVEKVLVIGGKEEMPLLKNSWKATPKFNLSTEDTIYICNNCQRSIEQDIYDDLKKNNEYINNEYGNWLQLYLKSKINPSFLSNHHFINCKCGNKIDYIAYSKFTGREEYLTESNFFIADTSIFEPKINGIYTREQGKRILEKFVLRWSLLASEIILVSPFIGFDSKTSLKQPEKLINLLEWFLTLNSFNKTQTLIRKSEYGKIRAVIGQDLFDELNEHNLINGLIEEINNKTVAYHAKFFAGIIPKGQGHIVEIISGSYNIHEASASKENLTYTKLGFEDFEKSYLKPLEISVRNSDYGKNFEILKVFYEPEKFSSAFFPKNVEELITK